MLTEQSTHSRALGDLGLLKLLHLSSSCLPVGAYAFSHGLESAVEQGWVKTPEDVEQWLDEQLTFSLEKVDLPILMRLREAIENSDSEQITYWNGYALACRETSELRLSDTDMAVALKRLLNQFEVTIEPALPEYSYLTLMAMAAHHWQIDSRNCCLAYLWSWLENQVIAATKIIALGQSRAQQLLHDLQETIPAHVDAAQEVKDEDIGSCLTALAIASSLHETQYSRLFRS